jgi:glycerol-3-phosphate O-acyltransferase
MRPEDQERILTEVQSRIVKHHTDLAAEGKLRLDEVLADTLYHERRRLKESRDNKKKDDQAFYEEIYRALPRSSDRAHKHNLERIVRRYADEISGNFDERVYKVVTRAGSSAFGLLMNAVSPKLLVQRFPDLPTFDDAIVIQGEIEHLRRLHEVGTVILVPTHVSNMDSIVVGYALYKLGLPPFIYGAGLNLFENRLIGYFMHNLGAYTVDRRKKDPLYKEVLKTYATLTLEHGYDNIFFPGGTRSRSGAIETKLKLGLMGTGISAYVNNLERNKKDPKVFVVPTTLSFQLCLEAETLIDDFLKEVGKSRYIITDDEFAQPRRIYDFLQQAINLDSKIYFHVGRGMDVFGNPVDDDGESLDPGGRHIDTRRYVMRDGEVVHDETRDNEFTRELGERVADAFLRENLVQATNVVARAMFHQLRLRNPDTDLVRLLRAGGAQEDCSMYSLYEEVSALLTQLRGLHARGGIQLGPIVKHGSAEEVVADALAHFAIYHAQPALERRGDRAFAGDRALLFYYQNRLEGYRLERDSGLSPALTPDHRSLAGT